MSDDPMWKETSTRLIDSVWILFSNIKALHCEGEQKNKQKQLACQKTLLEEDNFKRKGCYPSYSRWRLRTTHVCTPGCSWKISSALGRRGETGQSDGHDVAGLEVDKLYKATCTD